MNIQYYKYTNYDHYLAVNDDGDCYEYEARKWLRTGWVRAIWKETIAGIKSFVSKPQHAKPISESALKKAGIPLVTKKTVRDQPQYEYYYGEYNHYIAKGDGHRFMFKDGWWEFVHSLIPGMSQMATDEVLKGQILYGEQLTERKVPPVKSNNQICRLANPELVKHPLKGAMDKIQGGPLTFFAEVYKARTFISVYYSEYYNEYERSRELIKEYFEIHEREEDFYIKNYGLNTTDFVDNDSSGRLREAIEILKKIHSAIMARNQ